MYPIAGGWFRHDSEGMHHNRVITEVRYSWNPPDSTGGHARMMITVNGDGIWLTANSVPVRTERELEALERMLMLAHRQFEECVSAGLTPHTVDDDVQLYEWLGRMS